MLQKQAILWFNRVRPLHILIGAGIATPIFLVAMFIYSYTPQTPFIDQWEVSTTIAIEAERGVFPLETITGFTISNRHFANNTVTFLNAYLFGWNPRAEAFVAILLAAGFLILSIHLLYRQNRIVALWAAVPSAWIIFSLYQFDVWLISWNACWLYANLFFILALWVLDRNPPNWKSLLLAAFLSLCSLYSYGNGIASWGALLIAMVMLGYRHWLQYLFWTGTAGIAIAFYLMNNAAQTRNTFDLSNVPAVTRACFGLIGNPFASWISYPLTVGIGVLAVLLLVLNLYQYRRQVQSWRPLAVWVALASFSAAAVLVVVLTRIDRGEKALLATRYMPTVIPFWVALIAVTLLNLRGMGEPAPALRLLQLSSSLFMLGLIPLYLLSVMTVMQLVAREMQHDFTPLSDLSPVERCVINYPLLRDDCIKTLPFGDQQVPIQIYRLALYELTVFADQPAVMLLPESYTAADPVVVSTEHLWLNAYVDKYLLRSVEKPIHIADESTWVHVSPGYVLPEPLPDRYSALTPALLERLVNASTIWHVYTPQVEVRVDTLHQALLAAGYYATPVPITLPGYEHASLLIVRYDRPPQQVENPVIFDEQFAVEVATVQPEADWHACQTLSLSSWWWARGKPDDNYTATLVLLDADGAKMAQADYPPAGILTLLWEPEQYYLDQRTLVLPCDLEAGQYDLAFGMYQQVGETFIQLPVSAGEVVQDSYAILETIEIEQP